MAKKRSKRARNPSDPKHVKNRKRRKLAQLAQGMPRCSSCGRVECGCRSPVLLPSDPGYVNLIARRVSQPTSRKSPPRSTYRKRRGNGKIRHLEIPDFLQSVSRRMAARAEISLKDLQYKGKSKRFGAKAGRKKLMGTHWFLVRNPVKCPVEPLGEQRELWHGTPLNNASGIFSHGLKVSNGGLMGEGVYLGDKRKALNYAHKDGGDWGIMILCLASLGVVIREGQDHRKHDTMFSPSGLNKTAWAGRLRFDEWCVRDPNRVSFLEIHLVPRPIL